MTNLGLIIYGAPCLPSRQELPPCPVPQSRLCFLQASQPPAMLPRTKRCSRVSLASFATILDPYPHEPPDPPSHTQYKHSGRPSGVEARRFIVAAAETDLSSCRGRRDAAGYSSGPQLPFKKFILASDRNRLRQSVSRCSPVFSSVPPATLRMRVYTVPRMLQVVSVNS